MTLTQIDRNRLQLMRMEIDAALAPIKAKYGMERLSLGAIKFSSSEFTAKLECKIAATTPAAQTDHSLTSRRLGFPQNIVGMTFSSAGRLHTITGFKTANRRYPIITKASDGKSYKHPTSTVKYHLALPMG